MYVCISRREGSKAMFETWCYADSLTYGCYQDENLLSSLKQVDLFNGSLAVEIGENLCNVRDIPDQFTYNEWFGWGEEKSYNAPHPLKTFPDMYIVCLDTTTSTTTASTTTTTTSTTAATAAIEHDHRGGEGVAAGGEDQRDEDVVLILLL